MYVAAYSRNTERGIAQRAAQRGLSLPAPVVAPEPPSAPVGLPRHRLVHKPKPEQRCADVVMIQTPFAETRRIIDLMARMNGTTFKRVMSGQRTRQCCKARQAAICAVAEHFANKGTQKSLPELGRAFGGLDHTTVLHAFAARGYVQQHKSKPGRKGGQ